MSPFAIFARTCLGGVGVTSRLADLLLSKCDPFLAIMAGFGVITAGVMTLAGGLGVSGCVGV